MSHPAFLNYAGIACVRGMTGKFWATYFFISMSRTIDSDAPT